MSDLPSTSNALVTGSGKPTRSNRQNKKAPSQRDLIRRNEFNQSKAESWSDSVDIDDKYKMASMKIKGAPWKARVPKPATTDSPPRDENLYDGDRLGSTPTSTQISQNLDFYMFGVLVEETWNNMLVESPSMSRELPFAIFQHAMVEYLNAYLIRMHKFTNGDSVLDFANQDPLQAIESGKYKIPLPIHEYISSIGKSFTPTGESIRINLPLPAIIQPAVDGASAGSFGIPTIANHNVYETHFSPLVTARLVEHTIVANTGAANRANRFADWNPFPAPWAPAPYTVNENLLGYHRPHQLHSEAVDRLRRCQFLDNATLLGRLRHCPEALQMSSDVLFKSKMTIVDAVFVTKDNPAAFVYKVAAEEFLDWRLARLNMDLASPYAFGAAAANKANYFGFKMKRSLANHGTFLLDALDVPPDGWLDTINHNFEMEGAFTPRNLTRDRPSLREPNHREVVGEGYVSQTIHAWIGRRFKTFK